MGRKIVRSGSFLGSIWQSWIGLNGCLIGHIQDNWQLKRGRRVKGAWWEGDRHFSAVAAVEGLQPQSEIWDS